MRLHNIPEKARPAALRRVIRDIGEQDWPSLVEISKSDKMGKKTPGELSNKYDVFVQVIDQYLHTTGGKAEVKPPLNGNEIMEILGLQPGAEVGRIVRALKEAVLDNPEMTKEEATEFIKNIK
jgi:poly(A) polymerase